MDRRIKETREGEKSKVLFKFRKHPNCAHPGWSMKRKVRGYADYQPFLRWFSNEKMLRIFYGVSSRDIQLSKI